MLTERFTQLQVTKKIPVIPFVLQFKVLTEGNKKMETFGDEYKQVKRKQTNKQTAFVK